MSGQAELGTHMRDALEQMRKDEMADRSEMQTLKKAEAAHAAAFQTMNRRQRRAQAARERKAT